ncbi:uncharacterized protein [Pyrus communis]|uniref:uncharacterized protein n=1 Tax=Pyrus communis TaxID=23211 RepID=UPI0035BF3B7D
MKAQVLRRLEASLALISVYAIANHLCFSKNHSPRHCRARGYNSDSRYVFVAVIYVELKRVQGLLLRAMKHAVWSHLLLLGCLEKSFWSRFVRLMGNTLPLGCIFHQCR